MKCDAPDPIRISARSLAPALNRRTTMTRSHFTNDWTSLMVDASLLCADAGMVMALRSWRLMAGGPAAQRELARMFSEKTEAGFEIAGTLAGGRVRTPEAAARKTLSVYGRRVRENRRRLG
jgi:hypothetical protein